MSVFGNYSKYYNLLYRDKDYRAEADFVDSLISRFGKFGGSVLELGCGSGGHAGFLAEKGYELHGVDLSAQMLCEARDRRSLLPADVAARLVFSQGDIRDVRVGRRFDSVISLFHVMSYQTRNEDLAAALATAREHLNPGGAFIFDCWYGPAVLTQRPETRVKRIRDTEIEVTRIAEPTLYPNECRVDVDYDVFVRDCRTGVVEELHETHRMRYLFAPEIELLAANAGFRVVQCGEWMSENGPSASSWGVWFALKA
jgi:SAM-dependent methyltransferase